MASTSIYAGARPLPDAVAAAASRRRGDAHVSSRAARRCRARTLNKCAPTSRRRAIGAARARSPRSPPQRLLRIFSFSSCGDT